MSRSYPSDEGSGALLARVASAHKVYHHTYLRSHRKVEIIAKFSVMIIVLADLWLAREVASVIQ